MEDQELYRIEEYTTTGWELADAEYVKLEKPNCQFILNRLIERGSNPNKLRVRRDVGTTGQ